MNPPINMHSARMALNRDPDLREWAEQWLKEQERAQQPALSDEEFEKHWRYVRPEKMHEGAIAAVTAYQQRTEKA
jgi:5-formyltetrahydrofolate cyclo-ligase